MTSEPRGQALVIVNSFKNNPKKQRNGSEVEKKNLLDLLDYLGFEVYIAKLQPEALHFFCSPCLSPLIV